MRRIALQLERKAAAEVRRRRHHEKQLVIFKAKADRESVVTASARKTALQLERKIAAEVRRRRHEEAQLQTLRTRVAREARAAQQAKDEAEAAEIAGLVQEAAKRCQAEAQIQQQASFFKEEVECDVLDISHQGSPMPKLAKMEEAAGEVQTSDKALATTSHSVRDALQDAGIEQVWEILLEHDLCEDSDGLPVLDGWNVVG